MVKLDLGCGKNPKEGFEGVDAMDFGQKHVVDLVARLPGVEEWQTLPKPKSDGYDLFVRWPWEDASVEEVHCSHFIEHLTRRERVFFANELYRILVPGGKCTLVMPHFASNRAYGDMTHEWPAGAEMWFYYLSKSWREQTPHNDFYACDFDATWGYSLHPTLTVKNQDYQAHAMQFWKEACQDIICTLTARK